MYIVHTVSKSNELQKLAFYHATLMSVCDIFISVTRLFQFTCELVYLVPIEKYHLSDGEEFYFQSPFAQQFRSFFPYVAIKKADEFQKGLDLSSTVCCQLMMAVERYIYVCHGNEATSILSRKRHICMCVSSTFFLVLSFLMTWIPRQFNSSLALFVTDLIGTDVKKYSDIQIVMNTPILQFLNMNILTGE